MIFIKQSTVVTFLLGPFVDKDDGVTPETGLATNMDNAATGIRVSKNGAVMIDRNSATVPAHDDDGYYRVALSTTDTNTLGFMKVQYEEVAVTLPAWEDFMVMPANVFDAFFGADTLQVDLTQMGGVAQSATDLKDFADAGYDPTTDKITGCVLTDTVTNNTDMRGTDGVDTATMRGTDLALLAASINLTAGVLDNVGTVDGIATDAINAAALAADAVDEIRDALLPTQNAVFTFTFLFVAASDHVTPVTGATGTGVTRSIDGAAFGSGTGTLTEIANGMYEYAASAADMNGGSIAFRFVGTGGTPGAPDDRFVSIITGGGV